MILNILRLGSGQWQDLQLSVAWPGLVWRIPTYSIRTPRGTCENGQLKKEEIGDKYPLGNMTI